MAAPSLHTRRLILVIIGVLVAAAIILIALMPNRAGGVAGPAPRQALVAVT